jgi:hypothetical protein
MSNPSFKVHTPFSFLFFFFFFINQFHWSPHNFLLLLSSCPNLELWKGTPTLEGFRLIKLQLSKLIKYNLRKARINWSNLIGIYSTSSLPQGQIGPLNVDGNHVTCVWWVACNESMFISVGVNGVIIWKIKYCNLSIIYVLLKYHSTPKCDIFSQL